MRDNLVRVYEDKRYAYDGHGRLIQKLSRKHTAQAFEWDEESRLIAATTTRRPGTEHETTQTTRFDYDAIGRRVAKHDAFGTTVFIWEGMRLIEERRGQSVISYVYEPGSYVPLARLDAQGQATEQGGLGITQDVELKNTPETIATSACHISAGGKKYHQSQQPAANDAEAQYWEALDTQTGTAQKTGTEAKLCDVYYFHADQVGMPQELTNAQGQLVWQANYKTWGSTVSEEWEVKSLANQPVHALDQGDSPKGEETRQQNLRFQGQYLDRETGLHYNTFRYYDADIGRFICPDPIGLGGGINLGSYSPNPLSWIDPWGWAGCTLKKSNEKTHDYDLTISKSKYPETAGHIGDAIKAGHPDVVTINRGGASSNRRASLKGVDTRAGKDRDEWPMAVFREGGKGASVRHIDPSDNRGAGSSIGNVLQNLPNGTRVKISIGD